MNNLAVVDPRPLFRAGLGNLLRAMGFDNVLEAADLEELRDMADPRYGPDLLLVELSRVTHGAADFMEDIRGWAPGCRVVFLATNFDMELLSDCLAAGAYGYISENISHDELHESLRLVIAGGKVFPAELAALLSGRGIFADAASAGELAEGILSDREIDIVRCLSSGSSNKVIAQKLGIAEATVKVHVKRILRKTPFSNRTQVALWASAQGLVERQPGI